MESLISKMDKKVKFLFFGLLGLLVATLLFLFATMGSKTALLRQYQAIEENSRQEKEILTKKTNEAIAEKSTLEGKLDALQKDFDKITQEKDDLERKYSMLSKERAELIERLKRKETARAAPATQEKAMPVTEDTYWAGVLKEKSGLEVRVADLKEKLDTLRLNVEELKRDKAALEFEVSNLSRDKKDLEGRMGYGENVTDSLSSELVREKKDKRQLLEELKSLKNEHAILLRQLKTLNNQKAALATRLQEAEQAKLNLEKRVANMNEMLDYKLSQVMDVKKDLEDLQEGTEVSLPATKGSIELPPIVVRSAPTEVPAVKYNAKVMAVNKENNFIIIDLGEEQGLKPGTGFDVYRDDKKIASVEVVQIRKNVSACDIKQASTPINVGDEVR